MLLTFIRHGESIHNTSQLSPDSDGELSEKGREQARKLKALLGSTFFQAAISSPLVRALQTASTIYTPPRTIQTDSSLQEIRKPSALINLNEDDEEFKTIKKELLTHGHKKDWRHSDEESYYQFHQRVDQFLKSVETKHSLIVTHSGVMRMVIAIVKHPKDDPETIIRAFLDSRHTIQIEYGTAVKIDKSVKGLELIGIVNLL